LQRISVPVRGVGTLGDAWLTCVGTGRFSLALRQDYQDSLALVQREIGFRYIRGHGLLHDDVAVHRQYDAAGHRGTAYVFTYVDQVVDAYLKLGIKPFLELGFMPRGLASGDQTVFWWLGNVTPPRDHAEWARLVRALLRHLVDRYGLDEVRTWPVEVWNEPDLTHFWKDADQGAYFRLYEASVLAVRDVDAELQVGGPAISPGADDWWEPFAEFVAARDLPADSFSYWTFSDVFEEEGVPASFFHGGFGMVAHRQVRKPTFHLYAFMARMGPEVLARGVDHLVTRHPATGQVTVLAWQPVGGTDDPAEPDRHEVRLSIPVAVAEVERLSGVGGAVAGDRPDRRSTSGTARVFVMRHDVDEAAGNAWAAWREMGRPASPSGRQLDALHEASEPARRAYSLPLVPDGGVSTRSTDGRVDLDLTIGRHGVTLVTLDPVRDATPPWLDDSRILGRSAEHGPSEQGTGEATDQTDPTDPTDKDSA
jgi:beta-xylosidase